MFIFIIIISLVVVGGAGPTGKVVDGSNWTDLPAFKQGFEVCFISDICILPGSKF